MKSKFLVVFLCISVLLGVGFYPLSAQQSTPYAPGATQPFGVSPQLGQPPYFGGQYYGGVPPSVPQGYYSQGTTGAPGRQSPSDLPQVNSRSCGWVTVPQPPSAQSPAAIPSQPQTVPVQGLWPGAPAVQPAGSQVKPGQRSVDQPQPSGQLSESLGISQSRQQTIQQSSQGLPQFLYELPSTIEAVFQQVSGLTETAHSGESFRGELRQYGYSLFSSPVSTFAPVEDVPVGPDYILGPGDDVTINVWGAIDSGVVRTVDRNGQIILPSSGPVRVWGLTFSQAERLIREQLSRYYRGFQTSVTMGRLRTIRVYVVGEVCQPGSFTLSSLSTVTNALFSAGGPLKLGSLREITIKRNHHTVGTLDLYDFLLRGDKTRDFRLESGDTIFVPPVGPIAAIGGEVKRPGIYEMKGPTRVSDLIEMAGGLMPRSFLKRVQLIRTKPSAEREVIDLDLTSLGSNGDSERNIELKNGDLVRIYASDPRIYNTVSLSGAIKYPGEYELKPEMTLSQLLRREAILPEAYLDRVEIARVKQDLTTEVVQVSLSKAWGGDGSQDLVLRPRDVVTVRTEYRAPGRVLVEGEVRRAGLYTIRLGERLSSVLRRAGGYTDKAFMKGAIFTRGTVKEVERRRLEEFVREQEQRMLSEASTLTVNVSSSGFSKEDALANQAVLAQRREQVKIVASKVTLGRVVIHLDDPDKLEGSPNDIILEDGDSLKIPQQPSTVMVMGNVRNPTSVIHREDMDIQYYLNRAGGLSPDADEKGIYLLKADGSAITGFLKLRDVDPGDVIVVPPSTEAKIQWTTLLKDLATLAGQTALGLAALAAIF